MVWVVTLEQGVGLRVGGGASGLNPLVMQAGVWVLIYFFFLGKNACPFSVCMLLYYLNHIAGMF